MRKNDSLHYVGLLVLMIGVFVWRLNTLELFPFFEDELKSISVMRNIVTTGLPLTNDGLIYWRAVFVHYLMAIPLFWFDPSEVSTRLVSITFNSCLLPVVWLFGRRMGGVIAGWLAVFFVVFSSFQILYTAMARYYPSFEFLFLLTVYLAGEVFIEKKRHLAFWLFFSACFLLQTHHLALQIFPVLFLAYWFGGRDTAWVKRTQTIFFIVLLVLTAWLTCFWSPPGTDQGATALSLQIGGIEDHRAFFIHFLRNAPFATSLIIMGMVPVIFTKNNYWRYSYISWLVLMVSLSFLAPDEVPRYMFHLYPFGVVLAASSLVLWFSTVCFRSELFLLLKKSKKVMLTSSLLMILSIACVVYLDPLAFAIVFKDRITFVDHRPAHEYIKYYFSAGEKIISTEPSMTELYLGRQADYWLRENFNDRDKTYQPYPEKIKKGRENYFLDSAAALQKLLNESKTGLWLYASPKIVWCVSPETDRIVKTSFVAKYAHNKTYVLYRPPVRAQ